jgi:hypothetical protein
MTYRKQVLYKLEQDILNFSSACIDYYFKINS